jgi:hypothetical protein
MHTEISSKLNISNAKKGQDTVFKQIPLICGKRLKSSQTQVLWLALGAAELKFRVPLPKALVVVPRLKEILLITRCHGPLIRLTAMTLKRNIKLMFRLLRILSLFRPKT